MNEEVQGKPKKRFYKRWWFWVLAVIVLFIIIGANSKSTPKQSVPAKSDNTTQASSSKAALAVPQTLLNISGSGTKSTQKFTAASDWDLNWNYDCSKFAGGQGNF